MDQLFLNIKLSWNNFIQKWFQFNNVKECEAATGRSASCTQATRHNQRYCITHRRLLQEECEMYHFMDRHQQFSNSSTISTIDIGIIALVEHTQRKMYEKKYNLQKDEKHDQWKHYLQNQFQSWYYIDYKGKIVDSYDYYDDNVKYD